MKETNIYNVDNNGCELTTLGLWHSDSSYMFQLHHITYPWPS